MRRLITPLRKGEPAQTYGSTESQVLFRAFAFVAVYTLRLTHVDDCISVKGQGGYRDRPIVALVVEPVVPVSAPPRAPSFRESARPMTPDTEKRSLSVYGSAAWPLTATLRRTNAAHYVEIGTARVLDARTSNRAFERLIISLNLVVGGGVFGMERADSHARRNGLAIHFLAA